MLIDQDKELKNAILNLPKEEKDKLLLKLVSKDIVLMNQLRHKLLEAADLEEKRNAVANAIRRDFQHLKEMSTKWSDFLTPGQLTMEIRALNGYVNEHLLITKDKFGDIELRLLIFENLFNLKTDILEVSNKKNKKLLPYLANRVNYILEKYSRLHEDYQFDLKGKLDSVLTKVNQSAISLFLGA